MSLLEKCLKVVKKSHGSRIAKCKNQSIESMKEITKAITYIIICIKVIADTIKTIKQTAYILAARASKKVKM